MYDLDVSEDLSDLTVSVSRARAQPEVISWNLPQSMQFSGKPFEVGH